MIDTIGELGVNEIKSQADLAATIAGANKEDCEKAAVQLAGGILNVAETDGVANSGLSVSGPVNIVKDLIKGDFSNEAESAKKDMVEGEQHPERPIGVAILGTAMGAMGEVAASSAEAIGEVGEVGESTSPATSRASSEVSEPPNPRCGRAGRNFRNDSFGGWVKDGVFVDDFLDGDSVSSGKESVNE